jgi:diaminohydroxyphosphoribosylaminopyrimidine deaminase/5-amino-6-(5-phosphoribosylamino)uracil reductase
VPLVRGRAPNAEERMDERRLMLEAIGLARRANAHPNPSVGALVLDVSGTVVGRGFHQGPGSAHAEIVALSEAGEAAAGGTLVVTMEPCVHEGRTPPCTETVLDAGLRAVIVGTIDPDSRVAGRGIARLREAGLEVVVGVAADEVEALDPGYYHHRRTGKPRVTLKAALTLDGQAAASDGSSRWITSEEARLNAHQLRAAADAVAVGAGTVIADDPALTVRLPEYLGPQPLPVVFAGRRPLPPAAQLWERNPLVFCPHEAAYPGDVVVMPGPDGVDLAAAVDELGRRQILDLLVEGGPTIAGSFVRGGLVDRGVFYLAGGLAGGVGRPALEGAFSSLGAVRGVEILSVDRAGPDVRVEFTMEAH